MQKIHSSRAPIGTSNTIHRRRFLAFTALLLAAFLAAPSHAFHFFQNDSFVPHRWQSLPVTFQVDNGPTNIQGEMQSAADAWNDVPTAVDLLVMQPATDAMGNAVDFTAANFGTAWGLLNGDGQQEVVFDEDGSVLQMLGLDPTRFNGVGPSRRRTVGGVAVIDDAFLVINGSRTDFDRRSTEVHELGHNLGLAHSSVGMFNSGSFPSGALDVVNRNAVPTMHPFSGAGSARRTLEADDRAGISLLYPSDTFTTSLGTIEGSVTRCSTSDPLTGVNVRAINTGDDRIQISRYTAFDGNTDGRYRIEGVPPGSYRVVIEPLGANGFTPGRLAIETETDQGFVTEYFSSTECPEPLPDTPSAVTIAGGGRQTANVAVDGARFALVVDDTGSMGNEIADVRTILNNFIDLIDSIPLVDFPLTAVITYKDGVTFRTLSDDPDELRTIVDGLGASGGGDCPESSNAALLDAARLLRPLGVALHFTDADSRPNGPTRLDVLREYFSRGILLSTLLSGSCTTASGSVRDAFAAPSFNEAGNALADLDLGFSREELDHRLGNPCRQLPADSRGSAVAEEFDDPPEHGVESAFETFPALAETTGGFFFAASPGPRFVNVGSNIAAASVIPSIGLLTPDQAFRGTTINVEVRGGNTNFRPSSSVTLGSSGARVDATTFVSPTRLIAAITIAPDAALGFSDVRVRTDLGGGVVENANGSSVVEILAPPPFASVTSVTPSSARLGDRVRLTITGVGVDFTAAPQSVLLGDGITVESVDVVGPTRLDVQIVVAADASTGPRDVVIDSDAGTLFRPMGFLVIDAPEPLAMITSVTPNAGEQGETLTLVLEGVNTSFAERRSTVSFSGTGIDVLSTTVTDARSLSVQIAVDSDAALGFRDVRVTTDGEIAAALDAFQVLTASNVPASLTLSPTTGTATVGETFCTTATILDPSSAPVGGQVVRFEVRGANTADGAATTDARGQAELCYPGANVGTDDLTARAGALSASAQITWMASAGACVPDAQTLCLQGGRFAVRADWRIPGGMFGTGQMIPLTDFSGGFWFFRPNNVEIVLKVLNACTNNDRFWVFAAGMTNVETTLVVTDTETGVSKRYDSPLGTPFPPILDTQAFATCP